MKAIRLFLTFFSTLLEDMNRHLRMKGAAFNFTGGGKHSSFYKFSSQLDKVVLAEARPLLFSRCKKSR